jgi:hypothetical protein
MFFLIKYMYKLVEISIFFNGNIRIFSSYMYKLIIILWKFNFTIKNGFSQGQKWTT